VSQQPIRVCYPFIGDGIGGSHISALKLISQIDRKLVEPLIVLHQPDGILSKFIHELGLEFVGLPNLELIAPAARQGASKTKLGDYFGKTLPYLRRFLRSHRVQIVHTNDGRIHVTWALAARLAMSKVVWHHRADPDARGVNLVAPLLANQIISVSRFSQPRRPILPVARKLTVVRSPFEHPQSVMDKLEARKAVIDELGCSRQTRLLGYFGGLIDRKRPLLFVDIIKKFCERYPEIPVAGLLYGSNAPDGPDFSTRIRERAYDLGIEDRIFQMGFRQPIEPHFRAMDIMLVPAVNEPFGRTLIEAMMLGTPVIATNHGGNPEAITDGMNGFLVDPENAAAFVEPIHSLLTDDRIVNRIRDAALSSSHERYGTATHVAQITNIYQKLA
jgi:glycosyltransferase involved in cell wall biosynthesis